MTLERPYVGESFDWSNNGQAYTILERQTRRINHVENATKLELTHPFGDEVNSSNEDTPYVITGSYIPSSDPEEKALTSLFQYPLDTSLFASLDPAFAQMLGLYWNDQYANKDESYDYLLIADYAGIIQDRGVQFYPDDDALQEFIQEISEGRLDEEVDAYIVFDERVDTEKSITTPTDVRVYDVPGTSMTLSDGSVKDLHNNAGLRWSRQNLVYKNR